MKRGLLFALAGIILGFGGTVFTSTLVETLWWAPDSELAVPPGDIAVGTISDSPSRLLIPTLSIDATVQSVGITFKGNIGVPTNYTDVGWYRLGASPGQLGSAVIDGHVDNGLSLPAVFKRLNEIKKGDRIYVLKKDGLALVFAVTDIQLYPYNAAPRELIFNRKDKVRLNLITCDGVWVAGAKTYDKRLVVFAEAVD